ncbi:MAG: S9 family peptidase [Chitinophagaceae bacterium]|nr:S9 family peptidase [Chitinophagaceae bacterium]
MQKWLLFILLTPALSYGQAKKITLENIYKQNTFRAESVPGFHSMKDGRFYTEIENKNLVRKNFITGRTEGILINADDVKDENDKSLPLSDIEWSDDESKMLVSVSKEKIYRRSSKAFVYVYDLAGKKTLKIDDEKIMHASFSPDGSKVAFVKNNNLFYRDVASAKTIQITNDGAWNKIINGNCDWVYEEEFSFSKAFQWSADGNYLAYYKFNETGVPEYTIALYNDLYPTQYSYKYPKAGEANSIIQIHTYKIADGKDVLVDIGKETDIYIPRIKWSTTNSQLGIAWMNRLQNNLKWMIADANTGNTKVLYDETNKYYVDISDDFTFLPGNLFITTSEKEGYNQLYLYKMDGSLQAKLTQGSYDVDQVIGIDDLHKLVYFTAAYNSPLDRQLFTVSYANNQPVVKQITKGLGTHKIDMNSDFSFYVDNYSTINTPGSINIFDNKGKPVRSLKDNAALRLKLKEYGWSTASFIKVPNSKGDSLNGWMLKPANFIKTKKYPVLFCNYGGPGSQQVADSWGKISFWHQMLAQQGYIVVSIDNTGTGFRGEAFKKKTYLQLGQLEIEDQIDAAKYLGSLPYIDKARIGHWGWSFGGFMSSLAITKGAGVFKTAIAVAPVTDWQFYDNIYTERFMRTPQQNPKGYYETAPLNFTKNITGNFMIVHGTADDNVHFQNSVMMVDKMIENNVRFKSAYYPNKNHGISGGNTSFHIYTEMTDFILKNL